MVRLIKCIFSVLDNIKGITDPAYISLDEK